MHTETLRPKTKFGVRLTNCGRCAIAFPLSIQLSITEALNQCPPTQYAACITLIHGNTFKLSIIQVTIRSEKNYLVDWRQNSPALSQERYWNPLVIGLEGEPSALDWRILAHFLECHMQERPGKSFGSKLTPKSLSDDVALSPPIDFFSFFTQQIYLRDQHNPRRTWTPAYMHQKSIVNINPKSQLLLMRHLRWIHIFQSLHQQSATPKHRRKKKVYKGNGDQ